MPKRQRNKKDSCQVRKRRGVQTNSKTKADDRYNCGHCHNFVSKSSFYEHKRQFYNKITDKWTTVEDILGGGGIDIPDVESSEDEYQHCNERTNSVETDIQVQLSDTETADGQHNNYLPNPPSDHSCNSSSESNVDEGSDDESSDDNESDNGSDDGADRIDEMDGVEDMIFLGEQPLPDPLPSLPYRQKAILNWLVFFVLVWQYANMTSDNSVEQILRFLRDFLAAAGQIENESAIYGLSGLIPLSMYSLRGYLKIDRDNFEKFVVCPKCTKLYGIDNCLHQLNGRTVPKTCGNIMFPQSRGKKVCGGKLVKEVIMKDGTSKYYPVKVYCYKSIIDTIESMLQRPDVESEMEKWRERNVSDEQYADVYDGTVWKSFMKWRGRDFLNLPRSYGLMLNCDWFQPYKRRKDLSVGVLYMTIMNFPRKERFKLENVLLVGVIPALDKEPSCLNNFLEPLVKELKALWVGVNVNTHDSPADPVQMRAALLCCAADIPAARKLCGLMGHSARKGCSHCYKSFPGGFGEKRDFGGFEDRDSWPKRSDAQHRRDAKKALACKTKTARKNLERDLGSRYTSLLELPYYGTISMCIIDPMHNLFLGTAKKIFKLWVESNVLSKEKLKQLQSRIDHIQATSDLGRLPGKIASNYSHFIPIKVHSSTEIAIKQE